MLLALLAMMPGKHAVLPTLHTHTHAEGLASRAASDYKGPVMAPNGFSRGLSAKQMAQQWHVEYWTCCEHKILLW